MVKARNFILTKNNPEEAPEEFFEVLKRDAVCACMQLERGKEGTPHYQAFVSYKTPRHDTAMRSKFKGCHIEIAKNAMAAWRYCQKEETRVKGEVPLTHGIPPAAKNVKGDTKARNEMILEKGVEACVRDGDINIERYKQIKQSVDLFKINTCTAKNREDVCGIWYHGAPGTGKSHKARELYGEDLYLKPQNKWWDGYTGQKYVLLDDFDKQGACLGHYLKIWGDKYACSGETKGGTIPLQFEKFIITSNYTPEQLWEDTEMRTAIERRFKKEHFIAPFAAESAKLEELS